jgi:hypothetical protein
MAHTNGALFFIAKKKYPNDPENRTYAQLVAEGQFKAAI